MSTQEQTVDCFVCSKHRGEIVLPGGAVYEDDVLYVGHIQFQEGQTTYLGYLMIEPKRHAPGLADLTDREAQAIGLMVTRLSRALKASEGVAIAELVRRAIDAFLVWDDPTYTPYPTPQTRKSHSSPG